MDCRSLDCDMHERQREPSTRGVQQYVDAGVRRTAKSEDIQGKYKPSASRDCGSRLSGDKQEKDKTGQGKSDKICKKIAIRKWSALYIEAAFCDAITIRDNDHVNPPRRRDLQSHRTRTDHRPDSTDIRIAVAPGSYGVRSNPSPLRIWPY